jgi:hypothetical protein
VSFLSTGPSFSVDKLFPYPPIQKSSDGILESILDIMNSMIAWSFLNEVLKQKPDEYDVFFVRRPSPNKSKT